MSRYVVKFSKTGYVKYTSHLDLLRVFKRAFKKLNFNLKYSQGFNPHPKMVFAQPLSLGYSASEDLLEFETMLPLDTEKAAEALQGEMPAGVEILNVTEFNENGKTLAGIAEAAEYNIDFPTDMNQEQLDEVLRGYMAQDDITALKKMKKSKSLEPVSIKHMIRSLEFKAGEGTARLHAVLDCGSLSNCSPELVISSFLKYSEMPVERYEIDVDRVKIIFGKNLQF